MIEPGEVAALGRWIAVEHRVLAAAGHVDGERGEAGASHGPGDAQPVLVPAVDAAPVHDDRRLGRAGRTLQIADQLLAFERQLDDFERRIEELRRLAEHAQRVPVGRKLAGRGRGRIAADAAGVERMHVGSASSASRALADPALEPRSCATSPHRRDQISLAISRRRLRCLRGQPAYAALGP